MKIDLPEKAEQVLNVLMQAGYEAYAVGGCVRDSALGKAPVDWDITTSAKPEQVKALFKRTVDTGIAHGTVTVLLDKEGFEVTTYRIDGTYEDARHPKEVIFTPNLLEDLKRRDFTINAMAYNPVDGLVDAFDGMGDLKRGVIRCVGNPAERFGEDALRMMRAVRFAAQLGFTIEKETFQAICKLSGTLEKISAERIQTELVKLLVSDHPEEMRTLWQTGITAVVLPEFDAMMATEQHNIHHCYTVGEHTIHALMQVHRDKVLRLVMLFHDVAKPLCLTTDENGQDHFHGHPKKGSQMTHQILRRLKFDNETIRRVCSLVEWHDDNPPLTKRAVRRAVVRAGQMSYPDLFEVKRADILAQSDYRREEKLAYVTQYEACYREIISDGDCLDLKHLAVTGKDLIEDGVAPGPQLGQILGQLLELVIAEPEKNTKDILLEESRSIRKGK